MEAFPPSVSDLERDSFSVKAYSVGEFNEEFAL